MDYRNVLHYLTSFGVCLCTVFKAFDKDSDSFVNMDEWIRGLSVFLRGTLDEHTKCMHYTALIVIY